MNNTNTTLSFDRVAFVAEVKATSIRVVAELCDVPVTVLAPVLRGAEPPKEYAGKIASEFPAKVVAPSVPPTVIAETALREQRAAKDHERFVRRKNIEKSKRQESVRIRTAGSAALARIYEEKRQKEAAEDALVPVHERHAKSLERNEVFQLMGLTGYVQIAMYARANAKETVRFLEGWEPRGISRKRLHAFLDEMRECVNDGTTLDEYRERLRDERDLDELDGEAPEKVINEAHIDRVSQKPHKRKRYEQKVT